MNSKKRRCRHCGFLFKVCNKVKKHEYCSKNACQLARKRNWQKEKLKSDQTYREDQLSAQQDWHVNNPDYPGLPGAGMGLDKNRRERI
jgi:hypothetical protein